MEKEVIIGNEPESNHAEGIARIRRNLCNRVTKVQLMQFLQEDAEDIDNYTHEGLVDMLIQRASEGAFSWEDVLYGFDIDMDDVRICSECGKPMVLGVYADGDYYCSDECLDKGLGIKNYLKANEEDEDSFYYTEW